MGLIRADIDGDSHLDVFTGGYSRGPGDHDGDVDAGDPLGHLAWFESPEDLAAEWTRHDVSRRKGGMFDEFVARDTDGDGDVDFVSTRGSSVPMERRGERFLGILPRPETSSNAVRRKRGGS